MKLERMLDLCRRDQWKIEDINWSGPRRKLSGADEAFVVQSFTDMAVLELLAGELFRMQRDNAKDPVLWAIFDSFVTDEIRHSRVAERLAGEYDVHHYQCYHRNARLTAFATHFPTACRKFSPEIANWYTVTGELLLDVALLRSLADYVDDELTNQAMVLINRDESRHIAVDFHMVEHYSLHPELTPETTQGISLAERIRATRAFAGVIYHADALFREIFFQPLGKLDPSGRRVREAFKRIQLLGAKENVANRPFNRYLLSMQRLFLNPLTGPLLGDLVARLVGVDPAFVHCLYSAEEASIAREKTFMELAEEAVGVKFQLDAVPPQPQHAAAPPS
jgi:hypothetical protein